MVHKGETIVPRFNPRLREEATSCPSHLCKSNSSFNPRLREEATYLVGGSQQGHGVSIHASVKRRPPSHHQAGTQVLVSIHASVKRRQECVSKTTRTKRVSIHASVKRRRQNRAVLSYLGSFNPRLREEATPDTDDDLFGYQFQSTPP